MTREPSKLEKLVVQNVSRDLILAGAEALEAGAIRAYKATVHLERGHRASGLGQMRHFCMNETFNTALTVAGAAPTPLVGNRLVVGRAGMFQIARLNVSTANPWPRLRRGHGLSVDTLMRAI